MDPFPRGTITVPSTLVTFDSLRTPDADLVTLHPIEALVTINGVPYVPPAKRACRHSSFGIDYEIQTIVADPDDPKSHRVDVRVRLMALCLECGADCLFDPASIIHNDDGTKVAISFAPIGGL